MTQLKERVAPVKIFRLKRKLLSAGVAYRHVTRCIRELEDHYDDLFVKAKVNGLNDKTAAYMAESQLGDLDSFAADMAARKELKCLGSRFPKTVFLLMPFLSFMLILALTVYMFVFIAQTYFPAAGVENYLPPPGWVVSLVECVRLFFMHLLAPLLSCFFLVYGCRQQISRRLLYSGVILLNIFTCSLMISINWPDPAAGVSTGSIGASLGYGFYHITGVTDTKVRLLISLSLLFAFAFFYNRKIMKEYS